MSFSSDTGNLRFRAPPDSGTTRLEDRPDDRRVRSISTEIIARLKSIDR
jgi:hypothetical protein